MTFIGNILYYFMEMIIDFAEMATLYWHFIVNFIV